MAALKVYQKASKKVAWTAVWRVLSKDEKWAEEMVVSTVEPKDLETVLN
jgi:hypothetical protein